MFNVNILLFLFLSVQVNTDLVDEAKIRVQELRSLMLGEIFNSFSKIDQFSQQTRDYHDDVLANALIDIQSEHQTLRSHLEGVKALADSIGFDITNCYNNFVQKIDDLAQSSIDSLPECTVLIEGDIKSIEDSSSYRINIIMNEVEYFDYQIDQCRQSISCINPILSKVELAMVTLPQKIGVEIDTASQLLVDLKVLLEDCVNPKVAEVPAQGNPMINDAYGCVP